MTRSSVARGKHREQDTVELIDILTAQGNGSMIRGWRGELDPDGLLEVDFPDFCRAAARLAWSGDAHLLFGADNDFRSLTLTELAAHEGELFDRFKQWIKERFVGPEAMFSAFDTAGQGSVCREAFIAGCKTHGFEAPESDLEDLYDCCDYGELGAITVDEVMFLELDPKLRAHGLFNAKMRLMREWKQKVAMEYMERTRQLTAADVKPKHRLAPRPWQADIFEQLPVVACQRRRDRRIDAFRRSRDAKAAFLQHLRETYGSEVRGMRRELDPEATFVLTQHSLRHYCRRVQLKLRTPDLWRALDQDNDGKASFEEFAVKPAAILAEFQQWAWGRIGSCAAIWDSREAASARKRRSKNNSFTSDKKMLFTSFTETLQALGWPKAEDATTRTMVLSCLDFYGCGLIVRADLEWLDKWRCPEWLYVEPDAEAWRQVKDSLTRAYRHPLRAWRMLLDRDNSNQISWLEFKEACKKISFDGNIGGAWRALDEDLSGTISMTEYDPPSAELLESFKTWAESAFGSVALCFKFLDEDASGTVTLVEFKRACNKMGWIGDVRLLFDCLDADGKNRDKSTGKRSISLEDLSFLDSWQIDPAREEREDAEEQAAKRAAAGGRGQRLRSAPMGRRPSTGASAGPQPPPQPAPSPPEAARSAHPSAGSKVRGSALAPPPPAGGAAGGAAAAGGGAPPAPASLETMLQPPWLPKAAQAESVFVWVHHAGETNATIHCQSTPALPEAAATWHAGGGGSFRARAPEPRPAPPSPLAFPGGKAGQPALA